MQCTDRAIAIIRTAQAGSHEFGIVDVLVAIMTVDCGVARHVLNEAGTQCEALADLLETTNPPTILPVIERTSEHEARDLEHKFVGSEHLLLACLRLLERMPEKTIVHDVIQTDYALARAAIIKLVGT